MKTLVNRNELELAAPRRIFLRNSFLVAAPVMLGGALFPAREAMAAYVPPTRTRGSTRLNVRNYGAVGNGSTNDTAAIQRAINALPSTGGTVYIPAGTYMIDAVKSIRLRSKMHLQLDPGAKLVAIPNAALKAYVVLADKVTDIEISGGQIIGERYRHQRTDGEWGHAIFIRGSKRVTIRDIRVADCFGDGISLGAAPVWQSAPIYSEDVAIANVVSTNNRRQALTIGRAKYVEVRDSEFSNSNGVKPQTGIDIEPDEGGVAYKINIQDCVIKGNKTYGMLAYKGAQSVTVRNCTIERNGSCGLVTVGARSVTISANTVRDNSATGIFIQDGTNGCTISGNTFYDNYLRLGDQDRTAFTLTGYSSRIERDILRRGTITGLTIGTNYYR
ncbi:right-handed parallel beta-helix repeat-containing protein [Vulcaniibacterium thermophilum]|uniref:right-handed parallel beta-helix repeat-containing protein n=1 Tax=Vulcaniibacterium thermophilum TaxID=1169913 RepID=UPI0016478AF4|nr:glycoside hydrolase family 55 protein [Vulcaniibacterium thermophilum]